MPEERSGAIDLVEIMALARERVAEGKRLRRTIPGGRIHIDRPLPFLTVHRRRAGDADTPSLLFGQGSYLIAGDEISHDDLGELLHSVIEPLADRFGSFLVIELWARPHPGSLSGVQGPRFRVLSELQEGEVPTTVRTLQKGLHELHTIGGPPTVGLDHDSPICPDGTMPLLDTDRLRDLGCVLLGLEVPATYRSEDGRDMYPAVLRDLTREISGLLHRVAFTFAQVQTRFEPDDFRALGRKAVLSLGWEMDKQLTEIGKQLDFLLNVTPLNTSSAWEQFEDDDRARPPVFHYRPLAFDPDLIKRDLFDIEIERAEDPTLGYILREKRSEIDRIITMLEDRESPRFLRESMALYGGVEPELFDLAESLLARSGAEGPGASVGPAHFAERASAEIERYKAVWPEMEADVEVRSDIPGVMVVHGTLMVGEEARIEEHRVEALVNHEVGTHIVTAQNGRAQPLTMLSVGLPGYEETQEGLAVLAEYAVGGLGIDRLRVLAARVIAVKRMIDGAPFVEVFDELVAGHGFAPRRAWNMTMRVFRSGGLTKDAIYLRGLRNVLDHLGEGGSLDPLFVGKMPLEHAPLMEELLWREILDPPPLRPLWLESPGAPERLDSARRGMSVLDLVKA